MTQRPANPKGAGRPRVYAPEPMKPKSVRLTKTQREKLAQLGGDQWVRDQIDAAKKKQE